MKADDYDSLWARIIAESTTDTNGPHGRRHWEKVERIGSIIASRNGASLQVVKLFALLHDSKRFSDGDDPGHGQRSSEDFRPGRQSSKL